MKLLEKLHLRFRFPEGLEQQTYYLLSKRLIFSQKTLKSVMVVALLGTKSAK